MRFITHETVSALAQYHNQFRADDAIAKIETAVATLPPDEQKAIVKHYLVESCEKGCDHAGALQEGLKSLSHYYPTPALDTPDRVNKFSTKWR